MKEYSNWSFLELYNLPIPLRSWFLKKYIELKENEKKAIENNRP